MKRILHREISLTKNGNPTWIEPALNLAQEMQITDPRRVIPMCLCGGDKLISGKYQEMFKRVRQKETAETGG